jgi:hypothetical protein
VPETEVDHYYEQMLEPGRLRKDGRVGDALTADVGDALTAAL